MFEQRKPLGELDQNKENLVIKTIGSRPTSAKHGSRPTSTKYLDTTVQSRDHSPWKNK